MRIMNGKNRGLILVLALAVGLSACGKPKPSPYHSGNYPGKLKIGTPYEIDGRTYYPAHNPAYDETGVASWYGPGFHGRSTANGERFDQNAMTAAHRTLPMPSVVRVTNMENGKTAVLKVNDRGPFKKDRIIDLSKKAAEELDVIATGTAQVRVQYLPHETEQMIADLLRNNQLHADNETLTALAMNKTTPDVVLSDTATDMPRKTGLGLLASAQAAEPAGTVNPMPARGVDDTAPVRPVASRNLSAPDAKIVAGQRLSPRAGQMTSMEPQTPHRAGAPLQDDAPPAVVATRKETVTPLRAEATAITAPQAETAPAVPASAEPVVTASVSNLYVQAGSFSDESNARKLARKLDAIGGSDIKPVNINGRDWYRVRVGPLASHSDANRALQDVVNMGMRDARIVRD